MNQPGAFAGLVACAALSACTPSLLDYESATHTVRSGETLYTIAWRHGLDHRDLARWNSLANPDLIYAGQQIRLRPPARDRAGGRDTPPARSTAPARGAAAARPLPQARMLPAPAWTWPVRGRVVAGFGSAEGIGSGIAVSGSSGQAVHAAASGQVVYVGTGLAGYGQLVIVKHNDTYLSAYGHTESVLVAQGDAVARGDRIASMGLGPRRQARLHFEIRRNGVPVDPLALLPPQP